MKLYKNNLKIILFDFKIFIYTIKIFIMKIKRLKTKKNRSISINRNLDKLMEDIISNKSKYIEYLIYQDAKKSGLLKKDIIL